LPYPALSSFFFDLVEHTTGFTTTGSGDTTTTGGFTTGGGGGHTTTDGFTTGGVHDTTGFGAGAHTGKEAQKVPPSICCMSDADIVAKFEKLLIAFCKN
jgi:hypothetical protein